MFLYSLTEGICLTAHGEGNLEEPSSYSLYLDIPCHFHLYFPWPGKIGTGWEVLSSYRERQHNDSPETLNIFNIKNVSVRVLETKYLAAIASGIDRVPWRPEEDGARWKAGGADPVVSPGMELSLRCVDSTVYVWLTFIFLYWLIHKLFASHLQSDPMLTFGHPTPDPLQPEWPGDHTFPVISSLADSVQVP